MGTTVAGGERTGSGRPARDGRARAGTTPAVEPTSALVRLPVVTGAWAESIPPVPDGHVVTVSFSSAAAAEEHAEAFALLGYRVVEVDGEGDAVTGGAGPVAWLVVSGGLAQRHPLWWDGVRGHADAVFMLSLGPVVQRHEALLQAHFAVL